MSEFSTSPISLPRGGLEDLSISHSGLIASAGNDGTIRVRRSSENQTCEIARCGDGQLWACDWDSTGEFIAGVGSEGVVWVWAYSIEHEPNGVLPAADGARHRAALHLPGNRHLAAVAVQRFLSWRKDDHERTPPA